MKSKKDAKSVLFTMPNKADPDTTSALRLGLHCASTAFAAGERSISSGLSLRWLYVASY